MNRNSLTDTVSRAFHGASRVTINEVKDDPKWQEASADFFNSDNRKGVERVQAYGFSSVPLPRDKSEQGKGGDARDGEKPKGPAAEAIALFMGGQRNHPVIIAVDDRRHRPRGLEPGENAQYDDQGQMMYLKRDGAYILSGKKISMRHVSKEKQGEGEKGKGYKHEGENPSAEIIVSNGNIKFMIGGKVLGEVSDEGFVIGGGHDDVKKRRVFRRTDIDDAGNTPETYAKKGWAV